MAFSNERWQRPDWKGIVERNFKKANSQGIHFLSGAIRWQEIEREITVLMERRFFKGRRTNEAK